MSLMKAGVIGDPISHSLSPIIHGYWINRLEVDAQYDAIHVSKSALFSTLKSLADQGYKGVNVTVPHKEAVFDLCDELTETAKSIGAVNVLTFEDGKFKGGNSDAYGFWMNLAETIRAHGKPLPNRATKFLVLGAGGAARAVMHALKNQGYRNVIVTNRSAERAEKLTAEFGIGEVADWGARFALTKQVDVIINSTSLGMIGQPFLFVANAIPNLKQHQIAYDLVYRPMQTQLLKGTEVKGAIGIDGLGMLLHQAVPSFQSFFGPSPEVTKELRSLVLDKIAE